MIKKCKCKSDSNGNEQGAKYQDKKYGAGNRVHTVGKGDKPTYKCTVCGDKK